MKAKDRITALIPLDDRPCNAERPGRIARLGGGRLLLPPRRLLGHFTRPGLPDELLPWLEAQAGKAGSAVVSLDMLLYGGLIASRTSAVPYATALERLQELLRIRKRFPDLRILAFAVILRSTITVAAAGDMEIWRLMPRYSELLGRRHAGETGMEEELGGLERRIPREIREAYLAVRTRNHSLNSISVRAVADGLLDCLVLSQEDATTHGLHRLEQQELQAAAAACPSGSVILLNGADEVGALLTARALNPSPRRVRPAAFPEDGLEVTARYEDISIRENLSRHLQVLGWSAGSDGDLSLLLNLPRQEPMPDLFMGELPIAVDHGGLLGVAARRLDAGCTVGLADLAAVNGADNLLMRDLARSGLLHRLSAYGGWNTAGNSLGSVIAHLGALDAGRERRSREAVEWDNLCLLMEEYADDWLYQGICRGILVAQAVASGLSPFSLGRQRPMMETEMRHLMEPQLQMLMGYMSRHPAWPAGTPPRWSLSLPWSRLFEVKARCFFQSGTVVK